MKAQSTYTSANYATSGDTIYLTQAQPGNFNFDTTGASITWNYAALTGVSQQQLVFLLPTQAGFTHLQWPYIYNTSNVNLASTNGATIDIGSNLQAINPYNYFLKSSGYLEQKASSMEFVINNSHITIKNVYDSADVFYQFPLNYGNMDSSLASYTINIPGFYYQSTTIDRVNNVDGWGTVTTPYGTFNNCLRMVSNVMETDSITIDTLVLPKDTVYSRIYQWLDPAKNYPVLTVTQNKVANNYVTVTIAYFDSVKYFQPNASFAFTPLSPMIGDTVQFQNLSTNSTAYLWNFDDSASAPNDTSALQNPIHIFNSGGVYHVRLIAYNENGSLTDTATLPVVINVATGIPQQPAFNSSVYPNPFTRSTTIQFNSSLENAQLDIYNIYGQVLKTIVAVSGDHIIINRENLSSGLYFYELNQGAKQISRGKIVIYD